MSNAGTLWQQSQRQTHLQEAITRVRLLLKPQKKQYVSRFAGRGVDGLAPQGNVLSAKKEYA